MGKGKPREPHVVICVKWGAHTIKTSTKHPCAGGCGAELALSPATADTVFDYGGIPLTMCYECAMKKITEAGGELIPPSKGQLQEIKESKSC